MSYCNFKIGDLNTSCEYNGKIGFDKLIIVNSDYITGFEKADTVGGSGGSMNNPGNIITGVSFITKPSSDFVLLTEINDARAVSFNGSAKSMAGGTTYRTTQKTLQFVVKNNGSEIAKQITNLKNGKFVVFAKRPAPYEFITGQDATDEQRSRITSMIEVFGSENPMIVSACEQVLSGEDADGAYYGGWLVSLQTTELEDSIFYWGDDNGISTNFIETMWSALVNQA